MASWADEAAVTSLNLTDLFVGVLVLLHWDWGLIDLGVVLKMELVVFLPS